MGDNNQALTPWLIRFRPSTTARLRLFCFPYAGGGAHIFRTWSESLPPEVEVLGVQLPGRGRRVRETPFTHMEPLIEEATAALQPYLDLPYVFFGHSLGAWIAFELSRTWRSRQQVLPSGLFVSGASAPQHCVTAKPPADLSTEAFVERLRQLEGTPKKVLEHEGLLEIILPMLRGDFTLAHTYMYREEAPLDCPIIGFGGEQDKVVSREELAGWQAQTTARFSLHLFPGDHFYLRSAERALLDVIAQELRHLAEPTTEPT
jgi:medium-chain acyl-[acyl-carrier-protein] hydrolase